MSDFSVDWSSSDLQYLLVSFIIAIAMLLLSYKWYRNYKSGEDAGDWYSVMNGWDIVKWVIMAILLILAIITQIDFS
jgi:hypothetical protein